MAPINSGWSPSPAYILHYGSLAHQYSLNSLYGPKQAAALFSVRAVNCTLSRQHYQVNGVCVGSVSRWSLSNVAALQLCHTGLSISAALFSEFTTNGLFS